MDQTQPDFLGRPGLSGLALWPEIVCREEERALITRIDTAGLAPFRFQQWTGKRLTRSYGRSFDFRTGRLEFSDPWPNWLIPLRERAAQLTCLSPDDLVQAMLIRYDPGAGIGWHRDRPVFEHVIGVSLGEHAVMRFRRRIADKFERISIPLPARSVYHLSDEARHGWEHSIAPMNATRWSITFRTLTG